jgi:hypothetical protein
VPDWPRAFNATESRPTQSRDNTEFKREDFSMTLLLCEFPTRTLMWRIRIGGIVCRLSAANKQIWKAANTFRGQESEQ